MIKIQSLYNYLLLSFIYILNIHNIKCMIVRKTFENHLFPIDIKYKRSKENEIKSVKCTTIHRKNIKGLIYACIEDKKQLDIDRSSEIVKRPNIRQEDTGYCSIFAFNDVFYAKTGLSLSNSDSVLSNFFSREKLFYFEKDAMSDVLLRNQLLMFRNIDNEFNPKNNELNHYFDHYNTPEEILKIYQVIGNLLYVDSPTEVAMWSRVVQAFGSLYTSRERFCDKYKQVGNQDTFEEKLTEFYKEMLSIENGLVDLVMIYGENTNFREKQATEANVVRDSAKELVIKSYLLPLNDDNNENKEKLDIILHHLHKSILIAAMYNSKNIKIDNPAQPMFTTHHILVLGYSEEYKIFKIKDCSNGNLMQIIPQDTFLGDVYHISMLEKNNEII